MRFLVMHKVDAAMEAGDPPPPGLVEKMMGLIEESIKNGTFLNGAGLHRSAERVRLEFRKGERIATQGPYAGKNELIRAFYMIKAKSVDHATEVATRLANVIGDVEIEIGPVVEPWDLGFVKKPDDLPFLRFLLLEKATPASELSGRDATTKRALAELVRALTNEGVLVTSDELAPSARASRFSNTPGKRTWTDGPFAETKELVAGFSLIAAPTRAAALSWSDRYIDILGEGTECDVVEVLEPGA
jgi:hypothetical protein